MSNALTLFCYTICAYGICNIMVFGEGPFGIFSKMRAASFEISDGLATMLQCMMCLPTNLGIILSLVDWFILEKICMTPGCLLLEDAGGWYWIVALIIDGAYTSGAVWLLHNIETWFENLAGSSEEDTEEE